MVNSRRLTVGVTRSEIEGVISNLGKLTNQEEELIHDLPDHFRRFRLHNNKGLIVVKLLNQSIKKKEFVDKKKIFKFVEELIEELDLKKGIISDKVYNTTEMVKLISDEEEFTKSETAITIGTYHKLDRALQKKGKDGKTKLGPKFQKKIKALEKFLLSAKKKEKLVLSLDVHTIGLVNLFRDLRSILEQNFEGEMQNLEKLYKYKDKDLQQPDLPELLNIRNRLKDELKTGRNVQIRMKDEFYLPFQELHHRKISANKNIKNILSSRKKFYHVIPLLDPKITLQDVKFDYNTMTSPEEVLEYFDEIEKLDPRFVEKSVLRFIRRKKSGVIRKVFSNKKSLRREIQLGKMDPLTGLLDRRYIGTTFQRLNQSYKRTGKTFSIIFSDIDNFKAFNTKYGHVEGDKVLANVAHSMKDAARKTDVAIRYGGEEFLIFLPNTDKAKAKVVAERMRESVQLENTKPADPTTNGPITVSIGVATYRPGDKIMVLIERANKAMKVAKEVKNKVVSA